MRRCIAVFFLLPLSLMLLQPRITLAGDACDLTKVGAWSVWSGPPADNCFEIKQAPIAIWQDRQIGIGLHFGSKPVNGVPPSRLYFYETKNFKFDEIAQSVTLNISGAPVGTTGKASVGGSHELMEAKGRAAVFSALRRGTPVSISIQFRDGSNLSVVVDPRDFERAYQAMLGKRKRR
jgi:hypothetical protein